MSFSEVFLFFVVKSKIEFFPGFTAEPPWLDVDELKEDSFLVRLSISGKKISARLVPPTRAVFLLRVLVLLNSKLASIGSISSSILGTGEPEKEEVEEFRGLKELLK